VRSILAQPLIEEVLDQAAEESSSGIPMKRRSRGNDPEESLTGSNGSGS
jgi:hypothetical protein